MSIYDHEVKTIDGEPVTLSAFKGKVLIIVNTASKCGFTPQFKELQELYEQFNEHGLEILGFPCDQFMNQDPGSNDEIALFCTENYGVTFPMFEKIDVNGPKAHPLYVELKKCAPGILGTPAIKWNFTKFLVNRDGDVIERYSPQTKPRDLKKAIIKFL